MPASEIQQRERVPVEIFDDADTACEATAQEIAALIHARPSGGPPAVLGLATGSTPVRLYRRLIRLHRGDGLSFRNVVTFNLDEYYGLGPDHPESYRSFMQRQLFDHIDIPPEQTHVPDGTTPRPMVFEACARYEEAIARACGIDLQILGIGRTGHVGFNEPGSDPDSRTRLVTLDARTRRDAARDFLGEEHVPRCAVTMGVGTILQARRIVLLAWGSAKSGILRQAVEESPTDRVPASFLQRHPGTVFRIDRSAASDLTRSRHPWRVGPVDWEPPLIRRSVLWLGQKTSKPILKLVDADYTENGMGELLTGRGTRAYDVNIGVFNTTQHTITGWPGGKPGADDSHRPERASPFPKRVLVLAPEPLDDVLCLGGTLNRLVRQGHDVQVAFLTSGNLAVSDGEVLRETELMAEIAAPDTGGLALELRREIEQRAPFAPDSASLRRFKGLIRRGEARVALKLCGVDPARIHFLDLPFYEHGRYRQFQATGEDARQLDGLLGRFRPHLLFATGARSDPTSLDAVCFSIIRECREHAAPGEWPAECHVWLYRGGGESWPVDEIDMAVPLSPDELALKLQAIYQHRSQRSQTPVAGEHGEVWHLAEENDRHTALLYDQLGLAEYEAIETFQRWNP